MRETVGCCQRDARDWGAGGRFMTRARSDSPGGRHVSQRARSRSDGLSEPPSERPLQNASSSSKLWRLFLPLPLETFAEPSLPRGAASCFASRIRRRCLRRKVRGVSPFEETPFFPLSWGRGRFGRLRPKSVRGLPGTHPRVTQRSRRGDSGSTQVEPPRDRNGHWPLPALTRLRGVPINCSGCFG